MPTSYTSAPKYTLLHQKTVRCGQMWVQWESFADENLNLSEAAGIVQQNKAFDFYVVGHALSRPGFYYSLQHIACD
jgi:hypothetical protein